MVCSNSISRPNCASKLLPRSVVIGTKNKLELTPEHTRNQQDQALAFGLRHYLEQRVRFD